MKFDVTLIKEEGGITTAEVPFAVGLEAEWVGTKVDDLVRRMKADPEMFAGKVIVTVVEEPSALRCLDDMHSGSQAQLTRRDG